MYYRIFKDLPWPETENKLATVFGPRTTNGSKCIFYRVFRKWNCSVHGRSKVESKAGCFTVDFLSETGYFEYCSPMVVIDESIARFPWLQACI